MDDIVAKQGRGKLDARPRLDLQAHIADLEARGLLVRIDHPVNKDTELHPLVRLQFIGGIPGGRAARLSVHQRGRRRPAAATTCRSWSARLRRRPRSIRSACGGRSSEIGNAWMDGDRQPDRAGADQCAALPGGGHHGRRRCASRTAGSSSCRCRSRRRASILRPISPRPSASPRIPIPASRTAAPIGRR